MQSTARTVPFPGSSPAWAIAWALLLAAPVWMAPQRALGQTARSGKSVSASAAAGAPASQPAVASAAKPADSGKGPHEGITVHGYWKIDVRNPDGSLARHLEFENSLLEAGSGQIGGPVLVNLMSGIAVGLGPAIQIHSGPVVLRYFLDGTATAPVVTYNSVTAGEAGGTNPGPCGGDDCLLSPASSAFYSNCLWIEANLSSAGYNSKTCVGGLSVSSSSYNSSQSSPVTLPSDSQLTLMGAFTADTASTITAVATIFNICRFDEFVSGACAAPATPGSSAVAVSIPAYLTSYTIPAPAGSNTPGLPVTANQVVNVSVALSFQ
jgi:hypothetical protein